MSDATRQPCASARACGCALARRGRCVAVDRASPRSRSRCSPALTWDTWGDLGRDTGYDLVAGARVAHGQLPVRRLHLLLRAARAVARSGSPRRSAEHGIGAARSPSAWSIADRDRRARPTRSRGRSSGRSARSSRRRITARVAFAPTNFSFVAPAHATRRRSAILLALRLPARARPLPATGARGWLVARRGLRRARRADAARVRGRRARSAAPCGSGLAPRSGAAAASRACWCLAAPALADPARRSTARS